MKTATQILNEVGLASNPNPATPLPQQQSVPASAAQRQRAFDELVEDAIAWLLGRWGGQINKLPPEARRAAMEGWGEVLAEMTPAAIMRARDAWRRPYPPDPAAFQSAGERADAAEQFQAAAAAAGCQPAAWHRLAPRTYRTAIALSEAGFSMREAAWGGGESAAARAWLVRYRESCRLDDLGALPPPPAPPRAALAHRRDQGAADRGCAALRAVLAGTMEAPATPPPPPREWVEKMAALGVAHKP